MRNPQTPLSSREEAALNSLQQQWGPDKKFTREMAVDQLKDSTFERAEAEDLIDQLLQKGYLYEVDNHLQIT